MPLRTCIVTRAELPPEELIRFVRAPDGSVVPDLARQLPGRGVWVSCKKSAVAEAVKRNAFAGALRVGATPPAGLADLVEKLLLKRTLEALSLANKAGLVAAGFAKVETAIAKGQVIALAHAAEAAADGVRKLDQRLEAACRGADALEHAVRHLTVEQLSLALGRANVVHAALRRGGAATRFLHESGRLTRFRTGETAASAREGRARTSLKRHR